MAEASTARRWAGAVALLATASMTAATAEPAATAPGLTPAEERGREIYVSGTSPSGEPITGYFGEDELELPGEAATCGSCHGHDGKGRPESGVLPSNITWKYLTRSYGHVHAGGLEHPPFDVESLRAYMRTGIYPGGGKGDPSMPYYEISDRDLDDLIAYLKLVGTILDPGLGEKVIRIGTLVPAEGTLGEIGAAIREVIEAYFREVNDGGGVYGRRLELAVREIPSAEEAAPEALQEWLDEQQPFALVSPFTPRMDVAAQAAISSQGIPVIGPFTLHSIRSYTLNRNIFYVYPGLGEQLEALLRFADAELGLSAPRLAVVYPTESSLTELTGALEKACELRDWPALRRESFAAGAFDAVSSVERLREAGIEVVVSLGIEDELRDFLAAASERSWTPWVLAPGALSGGALSDLPRGFEQRLFLAYPTLPQDRKPWAMSEISRLLAGTERARSHLQAAISAYASASVLSEALRRAGRDLGRRELTAKLEVFYQFETGLTPRLTFTAIRRVGARGAYILGAESLAEGRLPEEVAWVEVD
jgi:ABC-type branched-subunit amino acid transport system substrate-binding protein/cytochrome c553